MQLIYGFRGSQPERLQRHIDEVGRSYELKTAHRWAQQDQTTARWLAAVRNRLQGGLDESRASASLRLVRFRFPNQGLPHVKWQAAAALREGFGTVAVLAFRNDEVDSLQRYLTRERLYPRRLGGDEFEQGHADIDALPGMSSEQVARRVIDRLAELTPTLDATVLAAVRRRIAAGGVDLTGRVGEEARSLLVSLVPIVFDRGEGVLRRAGCRD